MERQLMAIPGFSKGDFALQVPRSSGETSKA